MAAGAPVLWLIGGTGEAVELAAGLVALGVPCVVTVTTEAARRAYGRHPGLEVWVGELAVSALQDFMVARGIGAVLDASHPFAVAISRGAIAAASALHIPYWRYERPSVPATADPLVQRVAALEAVLSAEALAGQRVLLTLGYRWLHHFAPWQEQATLFARILPSPMALEAALAAKFTGDRIIALRPPVSAELECALWRQWGITRVITKASGAPGGEDVKTAIARQLGISLVVIDRPSVPYPQVCHSAAAALALVQAWWQPPGPP
jgi:precorrin-6A/cobalt-precorrin-6A reductase